MLMCFVIASLQADEVNCPAGIACNVHCEKEASCRGATINCPDDHLCEIKCDEVWTTNHFHQHSVNYPSQYSNSSVSSTV